MNVNIALILGLKYVVSRRPTHDPQKKGLGKLNTKKNVAPPECDWHQSDRLI